MLKSSHEVIVIGAGVSGLGCASRLHSAGKSVLVLEGRDRIGGRILSDNQIGHCLPLGASFFHEYTNESDALKKNLQRLNTVLLPVDYLTPIIFDKTGKLSNDSTEQYLAEFSSFYPKLKDLCLTNPDLDMHSAMLKIIPKKFQREHAESLISEFSESCGELADQVTVKHFLMRGKSENFISNSYVVNGYDDLIKDLALNLDIRLNSIVTNIEITKDNRVNVYTQSGKHFTADRAVVTLPLGVLKAKTVHFSPKLPLWKENAQNLEVGNYNRFYIRFDEVFWQPDKHWFIYCGKARGWFSHWFNLYPFTNEPILCVFLFGSGLETFTDIELNQHAMQVLKCMFGGNIPKPSAFLGTHWATDPFTQGGPHSYPNLNGHLEQLELLAKPVGPLHFAGEACRKKFQTGTVGSALESGYTAADEILYCNRPQF